MWSLFLFTLRKGCKMFENLYYRRLGAMGLILFFFIPVI